MEEIWKILYLGRKKLISLIIIFSVNFGIFWYYLDEIIEKIKGDMLPPNAKLIVTTPMEYLLVKIQLSIVFAGIITLIIFILYILKKYKIRLVWLIPAFFLFFLGFSFSYFLLMPAAMRILTSLPLHSGVSPFFSIRQFMTFIIISILLFSIVFELPLIVTYLSIKGFVSSRTLKEKRKHVIVGIFILTAIITADPTPFSQILLSLPLVLLYEISIWFASFFERRKHALSKTKESQEVI
ncbi:MAG: hypothetical protein DRN25_04700 [Thermoplasmata archaeon]|nr:MAG: hypothetical protein DRN25_04700 [Thermoplasmata archaeon]